MSSRTNEEIAAIRNQYQIDYGKSLEDDVIGDTSGALKCLLVSLIQGNRDQSHYVDNLKANQVNLKFFFFKLSKIIINSVCVYIITINT